MPLRISLGLQVQRLASGLRVLLVLLLLLLLLMVMILLLLQLLWFLQIPDSKPNPTSRIRLLLLLSLLRLLWLLQLVGPLRLVRLPGLLRLLRLLILLLSVCLKRSLDSVGNALAVAAASLSNGALHQPQLLLCCMLIHVHISCIQHITGFLDTEAVPAAGNANALPQLIFTSPVGTCSNRCRRCRSHLLADALPPHLDLPLHNMLDTAPPDGRTPPNVPARPMLLQSRCKHLCCKHGARGARTRTRTRPCFWSRGLWRHSSRQVADIRAPFVLGGCHRRSFCELAVCTTFTSRATEASQCSAEKPETTPTTRPTSTALRCRCRCWCQL
mmetsp:Transcript_35540/g.94663  ORF Transcript_35540/g.94663 Transcript_35540/m.94663 type:complete len:329 (+) Transcript_35540:178-1164(+)